MVKARCILNCLSNLHKPIELEHLKPLILGRSPMTKIKEKRCSKEQVQLTADCEKYIVTYKHIGSNPGYCEGSVIKTGETYTLQHNSVFEFLNGHFPHKIEFDPKPAFLKVDKEAKITSSRKRPQDSTLIQSSKRRHENGEQDEDKSTAHFPRSEKDARWESFDCGSLLVYNREAPSSCKVASYDMDGTLITPASGRVFPKDANDWKIIYPQVPKKLQDLHRDGYKIVIFTNQAGIGLGKVAAEDIQNKITKVAQKLGIPLQALISTGKSKYRKPVTGMWDFFVNECNRGVQVDKSLSFYVGDAAGRPEVPKIKKKDHSISDRLFALNLNLTFYTPEEHFLGHKTCSYNLPKLIPSEITCDTLYHPETTMVPSHSLEVILLVGFPGCGKSTFVDNCLRTAGFVSVNRDTTGSWQKCVSIMESAIKNGQNVVVDNTNPDRISRKRYITTAKKLNVPIRCFVFNVTLEHAKHNNKFRELIGSQHEKISDMIYNMYKSKYEEPSISEGFSDIIKVNFVPSFKNKEMETLYRMYLLEK